MKMGRQEAINTLYNLIDGYSELLGSDFNGEFKKAVDVMEKFIVKNLSNNEPIEYNLSLEDDLALLLEKYASDNGYFSEVNGVKFSDALEEIFEDHYCNFEQYNIITHTDYITYCWTDEQGILHHRVHHFEKGE